MTAPASAIALKNMYGVIHNPNKYHPNGCNPYIADLNMLPEIRTRMRLTICDATTACTKAARDTSRIQLEEQCA
jgi:hypothetical protein